MGDSLSVFRLFQKGFWIFLFLCLFCLFISLGRWQYYKAHFLEQRQKEEEQLNCITETPLLRKKAFNKTVFLEINNTAGQRGYRVFHLLFLEGSPAMGTLVERGWIPLPGGVRGSFPALSSNLHLPLEGHYYPFWSRPFIGKHAEKEWRYEDTHIIVQALNISSLESLWAIRVSPKILKLSRQHPDVLEYSSVAGRSLSPQRHYAYAWQWWSFAGLLCVYGVIGLWRQRVFIRK
jgi:cytochrome oxidase assembly protein ShyY1